MKPIPAPRPVGPGTAPGLARPVPAPAAPAPGRPFGEELAHASLRTGGEPAPRLAGAPDRSLPAAGAGAHMTAAPVSPVPETGAIAGGGLAPRQDDVWPVPETSSQDSPACRVRPSALPPVTNDESHRPGPDREEPEAPEASGPGDLGERMPAANPVLLIPPRATIGLHDVSCAVPGATRAGFPGGPPTPDHATGSAAGNIAGPDVPNPAAAPPEADRDVARAEGLPDAGGNGATPTPPEVPAGNRPGLRPPVPDSAVRTPPTRAEAAALPGANAPPSGAAPSETAPQAPASNGVAIAASLPETHGPNKAAGDGDPRLPVVGTVDAPLSTQMNPGPHQVKSAGSTEQKLPVESDGPAPAIPGRPDSREAVVPDSAAWRTSAGVAARVGENEVLPEVSNLRPVDGMTALQERIAEAVVRLRQTGREEYEAVVRPDEQTEILLRITWRDGRAEVQAELRRGDSAALGDRWRELQERLGHQGVKLHSLLADTTGGDAGSSAQGRGETPAGELATAGRAPGPRSRTSLRRGPVPAGARPGWESWA